MGARYRGAVGDAVGARNPGEGLASGGAGHALGEPVGPKGVDAVERSLKIAAVVVSAGLAGGVLVAGPLNPPAGPVASTYKTLSEVEPRVAITAANTPGTADSVFAITTPGSYYLTGNVAVGTGKLGIKIMADHVTVDLNGFLITGQAGSLDGVSTGQTLRRQVTVRNGSVKGMGRHGVDLYASTGGGIEQVHAEQCGGIGVESSEGGYLRECSGEACGDAGIAVYFGAVAERCEASRNTGVGFQALYGGVLRDCVARGNGTYGFNLSGGLAERCTAKQNSGHGFVGADTTLLESCVALYNQGAGIALTDHNSVIGCETSVNQLQGIIAGDYCTVKGNRVRQNGGGGYAGIWLLGNGSRAEDNECVQNAYGIYISGSDNFVARNTCRANPQGNFAPGANVNELAPVVTNPGTNGFATMTAWSNVAY